MQRRQVSGRAISIVSLRVAILLHLLHRVLTHAIVLCCVGCPLYNLSDFVSNLKRNILLVWLVLLWFDPQLDLELETTVFSHHVHFWRHHLIFQFSVIAFAPYLHLLIESSSISSLFALLVIFHLQEHAIQLFHFLNSACMFPLRSISLLSLTLLIFEIGFHDRSRILLGLVDTFDGGRVEVVCQRGRVQFFKSIAQFFLFRKLKEIFKSTPLLV